MTHQPRSPHPLSSRPVLCISRLCSWCVSKFGAKVLLFLKLCNRVVHFERAMRAHMTRTLRAHMTTRHTHVQQIARDLPCTNNAHASYRSRNVRTQKRARVYAREESLVTKNFRYSRVRRDIIDTNSAPAASITSRSETKQNANVPS